MQRLDIKFEDTTFPYYYGDDCMDAIADAICGYGADKAFIVTDRTVAELYAKEFCERLRESMPAVLLCMEKEREGGKTFDGLSSLAQRAIDEGVSRSSVIVAFGGGVPGNVGGLLAALMFRGSRLIHVPTTLIAMHDSVVSLKQAVNFSNAKNLLGTYYAPGAVYADFAVLQTLSRCQIRSGLVENVKNALAIVPEQIPELTLLLECPKLEAQQFQRLLELSIAAKLAVMAQDKLEKSEGLVLEYGHTIGHAIELHHADISPDDAIGHGEAVGIGMRVAGRVSRDLARLSHRDWLRHEALLDAAGVQQQLPEGVAANSLLNGIRKDNKRGMLPCKGDQIPMILLAALGSACRTDGRPLVPVPVDSIASALYELPLQTTPSPIAAAVSSAGTSS